MLYFAYGSNMSLARFRERVPSAKRRSVGYLYGHRLAFHKVSADGSAKCDACETGDAEDYVMGVLYEINQEHRSILDLTEGFGYHDKNVTVTTLSGEVVAAFMYYANTINKEISPYLWYKQHVLSGARENDLPCTYIESIEAVPAVEDCDAERSRRELCIYTATMR
jgi:hypothetical protein